MRINVFVLFFILLLHHRNFKTKTIMRPIAMKCTQEEFDSIKDKLTYDEYDIDDFKSYPYVSNFYHKTDGKIGNTKWMDNYKEIHETFDANIFLEACDIEVEKVWKREELQFRNIGSLVWYDCLVDGEYRLKPKPNYQKEIEALQQKAKENGMNVIINFEKI